MLAEEVLRGIRNLFRGDIRGLPARLGAVTREAEGTIVGGLQVVRPQEEITTVLHDTHLRPTRQLLHALLDARGEAGEVPVGRQTTGRKAKAHGTFGGDDGTQRLAQLGMSWRTVKIVRCAELRGDGIGRIDGWRGRLLHRRLGGRVRQARRRYRCWCRRSCGEVRGWCVSSMGYRPRFSVPLMALGERNR